MSLGSRQSGGIKYFKPLFCLFLFFLFDVLIWCSDSLDSEKKIFGNVIREIRIIGNKQTKEKVILGELASKSGEFYTEENSFLDRSQLKRLGIFTSFEIFPEEIEGGIRLHVKVVETSPILPTLKFQITDENGIAIGGGVKMLNLFGQAIFGTVFGTFGGVSTFKFILDQPVFSRTLFSYRREGGYGERDNRIDGFFETATELFFTVAMRIGKHIRIGGRLNYQSIISDLPGNTLSDDDADQVNTTGIFIGYDSRDDLINTRSGWWNELELIRTGVFGGDSDFWRVNLDFRRYVSLSRRHTLALFSLTTLTTGEVGNEIAPWQDFSIGGSNTIRGWELNARSGKNQFINTIEYRYTIREPTLFRILGFSLPVGLQLAFFADAGTAWNGSEEFRRNFIVGYGLGIRFLVPVVGVTRFDIGFGEKGFRIQFCLGGYEKAVRQRERVR